MKVEVEKTAEAPGPNDSYITCMKHDTFWTHDLLRKYSDRNWHFGNDRLKLPATDQRNYTDWT